MPDEHFQVSQGNVETLFSEVGNVYTILWQIYSETMYQILSEVPKFYYKNVLALFFCTQCVMCSLFLVTYSVVAIATVITVRC